jgi:outer membrane protein assembly factor BamB
VDIKSLLLVCSLAFHAVESFASTVLWEDYPGFSGPGYAGIVVGDFDGDGSVEAVVPGYAHPGFTPVGTNLIALIADAGAGLPGVTTVSRLPESLAPSLTLVPNDGGADSVAVVMNSWESPYVAIMSGVPLRITRTFAVPFLKKIFAVADVDSDGRLELVGRSDMLLQPSNTGYPVVVDFDTGAIEWTGPERVHDVGVTQLDADSALEMVFAGTPGRVVDGASHANEWSYPAGFGWSVITGRFDADPSLPGFAVVGAESIIVFRTHPYTPVRQINTGPIRIARTVRLAGATTDSIAVGSTGGRVAVFDPRTGATLFSRVFDGSGISDVAVADLNADGAMELILGTDMGSTARDVLHVVDFASQQDVLVSGAEEGPYSAVAEGDIEPSASRRVAYLSFESGSGDGPELRILDAVTGERLRRRASVLGMWGTRTPSIALAQLDGDPQLEILVANSAGYSGMVVALDGVDLQDQWRVGGADSILDYAPVHSIAVQDVDEDGDMDVVAGLAKFAATPAGRILALDGATGGIIWQAAELAGFGPVLVSAIQKSEGSPAIVAARDTTVYLLSAATGSLLDSAATSFPIVGMTQWGTAAACRIAVIGENDRVEIFRCDTLELVRRIDMPFGTRMFRALDAEGTRFLVTSGESMLEVTADGRSAVISGPLGQGLGSDNGGIVRLDPDGIHIEAILGSDFKVTRLRTRLDILFGHGFD